MRALRAASGAGGGDGAAALLARAVRGLSAERAQWGSAMCAELAGVQGARARWSFSLGCARTALALRMRSSICAPNRGGGGLRSSLLVALVATAALGFSAPVRYPALRSSPGTWVAAAFFSLLVLGYGVVALVLSRGTAARAVAARRYGFAGGLCVGAAWLMVVAPVAPSRIQPISSSCPWLPPCLGRASSRHSPDARAGMREPPRRPPCGAGSSADCSRSSAG